MNLTKRKILTKISTMETMVSLIAIKANNVFASGSTGIGTAEVTAATDNIKRVITSIAMPLRWSFNFCKYSNCCN